MDSNLICITCAQSNFFSVKAKLTSHNHSVFKITKNVSWFEQHLFLRQIKSKLVSCSLNSSETFLMVFKTWWLFLQGSRTEFHISRENFLVCSVLIYELRWWLHFLNEGSILQVSNKQGKAYTFFLSSEYERSQWVETLQVTYLVIYNFTTYFLHFWKRNSFWEMGENWNENLLWFQVLQSSLPPNHTTSAQAKNMSMYELQAWITSCRKFLKTNMGSFLMRSPRDEPLLCGDLHFHVTSLQGLTRPSDLFVVLEVDSYGHFFRKCKTQIGKIIKIRENLFIKL